MRLVSIFTFFLLIVIVSACEKEDILRIELKNKDPNQVTCRVPLTESIVAGELSTNSCGIHMNWNITEIAERNASAHFVIDVNGDSINDFQFRLLTNYSPGGGSNKAFFSELNREFSYGIIKATYQQCSLWDFYYNQEGVLSSLIFKGTGLCEQFTETQISNVDTVFRRTVVDTFLLPLKDGDTIGELTHWSQGTCVIRRSSYQVGIPYYDNYGGWPYRKTVYIAIKRIKNNGQIEYGWIKFLLDGPKGTVFESWIQND